VEGGGGEDVGQERDWCALVRCGGGGGGDRGDLDLEPVGGCV